VLCERGRNIVKERHGGTWCLRKGKILTPPRHGPLTGKGSQRPTDPLFDRLLHQPEPESSSGPSFVVYNAEGAVVDSASLSDAMEEKRHLVMRDHWTEGQWLGPGPVAKSVPVIWNNAGQPPLEYQLVAQPSS
jgi:hypothetical protein